MFHMNLLEKGIEIIKRITASGYQAYIVGGAVRDQFLNLPVEDIDIATDAPFEILKNQFEIVDVTGQMYGNVKIVFERDLFEITRFRKDTSYEDHRHPVVEFVSSIEEDLIRRDFTMNALALDRNHRILDLFDGRSDIQKRIIRTIGDPKIRFEEDALRVLRAIYFCGKLNFQLDSSLKQAILEKDYVGYLPKERVLKMLEKIISYPLSIEKAVQLQVFRGFPFYQLLIEICQKMNVGYRDAYLVFYMRHHFFPFDEPISKQLKKQARDVDRLAVENFSKEVLYHSSPAAIRKAIDLQNCIDFEVLKNRNVWKEYEDLPIHSLADIVIDLRSFSVFQRKEIEKELLEGNLKNEEEAILNFMKLRF